MTSYSLLWGTLLFCLRRLRELPSNEELLSAKGEIKQSIIFKIYRYALRMLSIGY